MCTILIKIWLRKPICHLLTLSINHRSLTKLSRPFVHFTKMHSIFLTSLLFQIFKEENRNFFFHVWIEKKAHQVATFFLLLFFTFTCWISCESEELVFPSPPYFFFIGSRKYWLVLLSAVSSQFSSDLLGRFPIVSLLHVLVVKTGNKVYCGHKRDPPTAWWTRLPAMSTTILQKPALLHNWGGNCITRTCKPLWKLCC